MLKIGVVMSSVIFPISPGIDIIRYTVIDYYIGRGD